MKTTAKSYGLSTFLPDERTHPEKNARAAARYLRHLHDRFGAWPLALAAYNAGETRVDGLLKKSRARSYQAIADRLPAETQMYVPRVEATLLRREGLKLTQLRSPKNS
jgi:membrane-bound lytic murein transglycosylase D